MTRKGVASVGPVCEDPMTMSKPSYWRAQENCPQIYRSFARRHDPARTTLQNKRVAANYDFDTTRSNGTL